MIPTLKCLSTLVFVVHASVGCCIHHAHTWGSCGHDHSQLQITSPASCSDTHHCHHSHQSDDSSSQDGNNGPHNCCDDHCEFVALIQSELVTDTNTDYATLLPQPVQLLIANLGSRQYCRPQLTGSASPPLRAHLLLGVLLV